MYIDRDYLFTLFSKAKIEALAVEGEQTTALSGSRLDTLISIESSNVDGILHQNGHSVPLSSPPESVKGAVAYRVFMRLHHAAGKDVSTQVYNEYLLQQSVIEKLQSGDMSIPDAVLDTDTAIGGVTYSETSGSVEYDGMLSVNSLRGSYS